MAASKESEWLSSAEFARRIGVSKPAVCKALKSGRISRREDGQIHWPTQSKAWASNSDGSKARANASKPVKVSIGASGQEAPAPDADEEDDGSFAELVGDGTAVDLESMVTGAASLNFHKARKEAALATLSELKVNQEKGTLVKQDHVRSAMTRFAIRVRDGILMIPDRVAGVLSGELALLFPEGSRPDGNEIERLVRRVWERESKAILDELGKSGGQGDIEAAQS